VRERHGDHEQCGDERTNASQSKARERFHGYVE